MAFSFALSFAVYFMEITLKSLFCHFSSQFVINRLIFHLICLTNDTMGS